MCPDRSGDLESFNDAIFARNRINSGFTFKKSGGGPGSSGAVSIDEQAVKPRQITSPPVECTFCVTALAEALVRERRIDGKDVEAILASSLR